MVELRFALLAAVGGLALAVSGVACPAGENNSFTGGGGHGTGTSTGTGGTNLGFDAGTGAADAAPPCFPCSADLKSITDCDGNVLQTCQNGQACAGGVCVDDACDAAKQSKSSVGCEYWSLNLDSIMPGACFAAYVTNTWTTPIKIEVDYDGQELPVDKFVKIPAGQGSQLTYTDYDPAAGLAPGAVAILFLSQSVGQPGPPLGQPCPMGITPALAIDPAVHGTNVGKAFHITTDGPIAAYQIFPYGGGSAAITSATLLLPTSAWDTNYVAVNAFAATQVDGNWGLPSLNILAGEDATQVTISPVADIAGGPGIPGGAKGQPMTFMLKRGQHVQFTQAAELTGSAIQSSKPIAVFGGNACMNVPVTKAACDTGQQQIPPVRALGSEYAAVRYRGRGGLEEIVPWRFVGAVDGTTLTYLPQKPSGAPDSLAYGQVVQIQAPGPFVVKSQDADHPFYMSAHMTGGEDFSGEGDPEFVNIIPTAQFLTSYVFFTDPTYPETNLVLVRAKGPNGFEDVNLDCAGTVTGWQPLGPYEFARVDLVTGAFQSVKGCANGTHRIESKGPFGATVWGWGSLKTFPYLSQYVSYAYPAGAGVRPVNQAVVPAIPK